MDSISIGLIDARLLSQLSDLVNGHLSLVPPGWTMSPATLSNVIGRTDRLWKHHYPDHPVWNAGECLCASDNGRLVAAAEWVMVAGEDTSFIPWITVAPGAHAPATLLLEEIRQRAASAGARHVSLNARNALGVGWIGVPLTWRDVMLALRGSGFAPRNRWMIMTRDTSAVMGNLNSRPHDSVAFETIVDDALGDLTVVARADGSEVGQCEAWRPPKHFSEAPDFPRWVTIEWLGVDEGHRNLGIGRTLLIEQLKEQQKRGVGRVIGWTEVGNQPSRELLTSAGFSSGPECHTMWSDVG